MKRHRSSNNRRGAIPAPLIRQSERYRLALRHPNTAFAARLMAADGQRALAKFSRGGAGAARLKPISSG